MTKQLTFLISQPRAGSTMTQKILGSHPDVYTQSESWILLHPLHAAKKENIVTSYDQNLYIRGLEGFLQSLPAGKREYIKGIAKTYRGFYNSILDKTEKKIFLDKTPRYYLIIDEILEYFPDAKIILLIRNPLAVLNSIIKTWQEQNLFQLVFYKQDILRAPIVLNEWLRKIETDRIKNVYSIKYEDLLQDPVPYIRKITDFLNIKFDSEMIYYGKNNEKSTQWHMGDQKTVYSKDSPDKTHVREWIQNLADPQIWRLQNDYFIKIRNTIDNLGYDSNEINKILEDYKPNQEILNKTHSLSVLLDDQRDALLRLNHYQTIVRNKDNQLQQKDQYLQQKNEQLQQKEQQLQQKDSEIVNIKKSWSFRIGYYFLHPWKLFFK